jgi:hypothetical protein
VITKEVHSRISRSSPIDSQDGLTHVETGEMYWVLLLLLIYELTKTQLKWNTLLYTVPWYSTVLLYVGVPIELAVFGCGATERRERLQYSILQYVRIL